MSDQPSDVEEVQRRLGEIQRRKRNDVRWTISRHTAELAMEAIVPAREAEPAKSKGKSRRRKRRKRML